MLPSLRRRASAPDALISPDPSGAQVDRSTPLRVAGAPARRDTPAAWCLPGTEPSLFERMPVAALAGRMERGGAAPLVREAEAQVRRPSLFSRLSSRWSGGEDGGLSSLLFDRTVRQHSVADASPSRPAPEDRLGHLYRTPRQAATQPASAASADAVTPEVAAPAGPQRPSAEEVRAWRQREMVALGAALAVTSGRSRSGLFGGRGEIDSPKLQLRQALLKDPASLVDERLARYITLVEGHGVSVSHSTRASSAAAASVLASSAQLVALRSFLSSEADALERQCRAGLPGPIAALLQPWAEGLRGLADRVGVAMAMQAARSPGWGASPLAGQAWSTPSPAAGPARAAEGKHR